MKRGPVKRRYQVAIKKEQMNSEVLQNPGGQAEVHVQVAPVPEKRAQADGECGHTVTGCAWAWSLNNPSRFLYKMGKTDESTD